MLSYRARSEAELRSRLLRLGFPEATADKTLVKLRSLNYIDDSAFARAWARDRAESRGFGPRRIERELKEKGISPSLIQEIVRENFRQGEEEERAKKLIEKRFRGKNLNDAKVLRRAIAFLQRRGYASGVILDLLRHSPEEN